MTYFVRTSNELILEIEAESRLDARLKAKAQCDADIVDIVEGKDEGARPVFLEASRDGYTPDQCKRTMTVGELIALLEQFDEDRPVYLRNDGGYTYGSIQELNFVDSEEVGL